MSWLHVNDYCYHQNDSNLTVISITAIRATVR